MDQTRETASRSRVTGLLGYYASITGLTVGFVYALGAIVSTITFLRADLPLGRALLLTPTQEVLQRGASDVVIKFLFYAIIFGSLPLLQFSILMSRRLPAIHWWRTAPRWQKRVAAASWALLSAVAFWYSIRHSTDPDVITINSLTFLVIIPSAGLAFGGVARGILQLRKARRWTMTVALLCIAVSVIASASYGTIRLDSVTLRSKEGKTLATGLLLQEDGDKWHLGQADGSILVRNTPDGGTASIVGPQGSSMNNDPLTDGEPLNDLFIVLALSFYNLAWLTILGRTPRAAGSR